MQGTGSSATSTTADMSRTSGDSWPVTDIRLTVTERLLLLRDVVAFSQNVEPDTIARLAQAKGYKLTPGLVRQHFSGAREPSELDLRAYRVVLGYGEDNWQLFSSDPVVYARSAKNLQNILLALREQYYHGMRRVTS